MDGGLARLLVGGQLCCETSPVLPEPMKRSSTLSNRRGVQKREEMRVLVSLSITFHCALGGFLVLGCRNFSLVDSTEFSFDIVLAQPSACSRQHGDGIGERLQRSGISISTLEGSVLGCRQFLRRQWWPLGDHLGLIECGGGSEWRKAYCDFSRVWWLSCTLCRV